MLNLLPPDLQLALSRFVDARIEAKISSKYGAVADVYSQLDGERPVGCGAPKYLRVHKRARDAGDVGAMVQGRARLMTADCWSRWCDSIPSRARKAPPAPVSAVSVDARVLADLVSGRKAS